FRGEPSSACVTGSCTLTSRSIPQSFGNSDPGNSRATSPVASPGYRRVKDNNMAVTNYERVGKAMELLRQGLALFVEREVQDKIQAGAVRMAAIRRFVDDPNLANKPISDWDVAGLLKLMWETWNDVFKITLGFAERSLVSELCDVRNKWAHQEPFS